MAEAGTTLSGGAGAFGAKAEEMRAHGEAILLIMDQIKTEVLSLSGAWQDAAADEYLSRFKRLCGDADDMLADMAEQNEGLSALAAHMERAAEDPQDD